MLIWKIRLPENAGFSQKTRSSMQSTLTLTSPRSSVHAAEAGKVCAVRRYHPC